MSKIQFSFWPKKVGWNWMSSYWYSRQWVFLLTVLFPFVVFFITSSHLSVAFALLSFRCVVLLIPNHIEFQMGRHLYAFFITLVFTFTFSKCDKIMCSFSTDVSYTPQNWLAHTTHSKHFSFDNYTHTPQEKY